VGSAGYETDRFLPAWIVELDGVQRSSGLEASKEMLSLWCFWCTETKLVYLESSTSLQRHPGFSDTGFQCLVCTETTQQNQKSGLVFFAPQQRNT